MFGDAWERWSPLDPVVFLVGGSGAALGVVMLALGRLLLPKEKRFRLRFPGWLLLAHMGVVGGHVLLTGGGPAHPWVEGSAAVLLALSCGRLGLLLLVDGIYNRQPGAGMPAIYSDILQGLVFVGVMYFALRSAGVEPTSLLTTSALLTAVIGLSLQDTLGNLVAGLAIHAQKPFEVGDTIQFDNDAKHAGRVMEINWRATRLLSDDGVEVVVPNGPLAKNWILNLSKPGPLRRRTLNVVVPNTVPPRRVRALVEGVMQDVPGVERDPPPGVRLISLKETGAEYALHWAVVDASRRDAVDAEVKERLWYALERASALPGSARMGEPELRVVERTLRHVDFLQPLSDDDIKVLATRCVRRTYIPNDTIIRQGEEGHELFIMESGEVRILAGGTEVARLSSGEFFGEMSLLTGEKRRATVVAVSEVRILEVGFGAFNELLTRSPALAEGLSGTLALRQIQLEKARAREEGSTPPGAVAEASRALLQRIRSFFGLR